jgi:hypothetical protein
MLNGYPLPDVARMEYLQSSDRFAAYTRFAVNRYRDAVRRVAPLGPECDATTALRDVEASLAATFRIVADRVCQAGGATATRNVQPIGFERGICYKLRACEHRHRGSRHVPFGEQTLPDLQPVTYGAGGGDNENRVGPVSAFALSGLLIVRAMHIRSFTPSMVWRSQWIR